VEILIPVLYNNFWLIFKYKFTFSKKRLFHYQYMKSDKNIDD
jgi:hypothetical protein